MSIEKESPVIFFFNSKDIIFLLVFIISLRSGSDINSDYTCVICLFFCTHSEYFIFIQRQTYKLLKAHNILIIDLFFVSKSCACICLSTLWSYKRIYIFFHRDAECTDIIALYNETMSTAEARVRVLFKSFFM